MTKIKDIARAGGLGCRCRVAGQIGLRVPEDLQIIGFDGVLDARESHPRLTTVQQDLPRMAKEAVELHLRRLRRENVPGRVEVPARLVIGETTK